MAMSPATWAALRALFEQALALPPAQREAFVATAAPDLQGELSALLAHHLASTGAHPFLVSPATPSQAARPGQRLGAWEIVAPLGTGGMGEVFEARRADGRYEGRAAVKLLKRGMDSSAVLQRFALERQALARLSHPHIARLLDAGASDEGLPYFVLEYVDGQPIDQAVRGLPLEARLKLFLQLADAVGHAHRNLLVHRDLKPSNVLVDGQAQVKLLDFGIAKALDPLEGPDSDVTVGGVRPFTPNYASPEQVRGEPVTTATDIYSLGVLLYQMLTGTRPTGRDAASPAEAARSVLEDAPTRPSSLSAAQAIDPQWLVNRRRLAGDLDNILLKSLDKTIERRYASVDALAADVRAFLQGFPVSARAPSAAYVTGKFVRRHRIGTALAGLALTAVLGSGALAWHQADRANARFEDLRQLARAVLFDYHDLVEPLAGATPVRKRLVVDALSYLDRLSQDAPSNRALRREMGVAYRVVGLVQRNGYRRAHLGDTAGAMRSYARSITALTQLVAEDASDADSAYELALALSARAAVEGEDGNLASARPALQRAAALFSAHLSHDTPDLLFRLELARTHLRLADVFWVSRDYAGLQAGMADARAELNAMAAMQPGHKDLPHVWVWVHAMAALAFRAQGDWAGIRREITASREILMALHKQEPDNARYLEDLAGNAQWMLLAAGRLRDVAGAERWGLEACERWGDLARRDPDDRNTLARYLDTLINSGGDLALAGAPEPGLQRLAAVREPLQAATKRWHDQPDIRAREVHFATTLGIAQQAAGRSRVALAQLDAAQALAVKIQAEFPGPQPVLETGAAVAGFYRARVLVESAEPGVAKAAMTAAVAQMQALQDRRALVPSTRFALIEEGRRLLLTLN